MSRVLTLAALLLALVILVDLRARQPAELAADGSDGRDGLVVFSTGFGLHQASDVPPAGLAAICLDREVLAAPGDPDGLRAASTTAAGELLAFQSFDLRADPAAAGALAEFAAAQPRWSVLALAVRGSIQPAGEDAAGRAAVLDALLAELGARARPHAARAASWGLVAHRRPDGWRPLAEAFSRTRGVRLAVPLGREHLERRAAAPILDRALGVPLLVPLAERSLQPGVRVQRAVEREGGAIDAVTIQRWGGALVWPDIEAGAKPRFTCAVARAPAALRGSPVTLELKVDGEPVAARTLAPGTPPAWEAWDVDLTRFAGRRFALELSASVAGDEPGAVLCGAPVVSWEP